MWLFQGVLNAGLQILLSIFGGWLCARLKLVDPEVLSRQLNAFAMRAAFPAFIIHLLGIKTDLQDLEAWKALGVFILWVFLIHMGCIAYHKLRCSTSTVQTLGINCLLLTTNNTGCIGWPVLIATVGRQGAALSMLLGVLFFVQLLPAAITCFEYHKFLQEHQLVGSTNSSTSNIAATETATAEQALLPTTVDPAKGRDQQPAIGFPHEFRYCYWSNADYVPSKPAPAAAGTGASNDKARPFPNYVEVCVDASKDVDDPDGELDHHCYGGGRSSSSAGSRASSSNGSSSNSSNNAAATATPMTPRQQASAAVAKAGSSAAAAAAAAKEWWRSGISGTPKKQDMGLKRAKDSCDSLYSPFAAAGVGGASSKEADMKQKPHVVQSPRPGQQLSNLTRRLSRGLGQQTAAAAAAASSAAGTLVRAASLKKQQQQQQRGAVAGMNVPLLSEHEGSASCGGTTEPALATSSVTLAELDAARRLNSPAAAADASTLSSSAPGRGSRDGAMARTSAAGEAALAAFEAVCAEQQHDAARRSQTIGLGIGAAASFAKAADSAIELHTMCLRTSDGNQQQQQQQQEVQCNFNPFEAHERQLQLRLAVNSSSLSAASAPIAAAAGAGSGGLLLQNSSIASGNGGSFLRGYGLGGSNARINSRTALLGLGGASDSAAAAAGAATAQPAVVAAAPAGAKPAAAGEEGGPKGKTKLSSVAHGAATAAGAAGASCVGDLETKEEVVPHRGCFGAFMRNHPLLVHITAVQLKSFHLWLNVVAIALSVSGARKYLDADSPHALPALGWLDGVLGWFSSACIPVLLFANGVWMVGKDITGGKRGQIQVTLLLLLKLAVLPALMIGLTQLMGMRNTYGLSLVLLSSCPLAPLAFLVCQQYGVGAELATSVTIQGVLLMLPQMMAIIKISQVAGLYDVELLKAA